MLHIAPEMITADQVIPPIFEAKMGGVLVTIFRGNTALETTQKATHILSTKQQEILNYLSTYPSASRKEMAENSKCFRRRSQTQP
jgi:hypothetical protein